MTRTEIYTAIRECLRGMEEVKHIDLWNRNVEFIEQETAWERPAVFVEFGTIQWQPLSGGRSRMGRATVRLHIVTDWNPANPMEAFGLTTKIRTALAGLRGDTFRGLELGETLTNHDHEELVESIEVYNVRTLWEEY